MNYKKTKITKIITIILTKKLNNLSKDSSNRVKIKYKKYSLKSLKFGYKK